MCGLPGNTLGAQSFISGPSGFVRDKIFGRGTSQKIVDRLDRIHMSTVGKVIPSKNFEGIGFPAGSVPGPNESGNIDFSAEKRRRRRRRDEAERQSFLRANQRTILGE